VFRLISGLHHVHTAGYVHRDIKIENCLIDDKLNLYLIDFGLAEAWDKPYKTKILVGTKMYMAPEILDQESDQNPYKPTCDIWAAGILTFVLLSGHFPFSGFEVDD
jgi:serine/threonine protein kinase